MIMDFNNQTGNLPLGLSMAAAMNEQVKAGYDSLTETEKEHLILKCKDAKSKEEIDRIIASLDPAENIGSLFRGPSIG